MTNEAAERLLEHLQHDDLWLPIAAEALAAERRATVERIRAVFDADGLSDGEWFKAVRAILDAEAAR